MQLIRGLTVDIHNGPGTPREPAVLVRRVAAAHPLDDLRIEVWEVVYVSEPWITQVRGLRPQDPHCVPWCCV